MPVPPTRLDSAQLRTLAHPLRSRLLESEVVDSPEAQAAVDWTMGHDLRTFVQTAEACLAARKGWPQVWRDQVAYSNVRVELTPTEAEALSRDMIDLLRRYEQLPPDRESPEGEQRQPILCFTFALPQVEPEG